jgi:hypothetical protein
VISSGSPGPTPIPYRVPVFLFMMSSVIVVFVWIVKIVMIVMIVEIV